MVGGGGGGGRNEVEWTGKVEIRTEETNFWQWMKHACRLYSDVQPALEREPLTALGSHPQCTKSGLCELI